MCVICICVSYVCVLVNVCAHGSRKLMLGVFLNCVPSCTLWQSLPWTRSSCQWAFGIFLSLATPPELGLWHMAFIQVLGIQAQVFPSNNKHFSHQPFPKPPIYINFILFLLPKQQKQSIAKLPLPPVQFLFFGSANLLESQTLTTCKKLCLYVWTQG